MYRIVLIAAVALLACAPAFADTHIKGETHREVYEDGKLVSKDKLAEHELWVGKHKMLYSAWGRTVIVDQEKNTFTFINHKNKSYLVTPLPVDMEKVASQEVKDQNKIRKTTGFVEETGKEKDINGRKCKEYKTHIYNVEGERVVNSLAISVWATTDVPFDWKIHAVLMDNYRNLQNRDETLRKELAKIQGAQMLLELSREVGEQTQKNVERATEIKEAAPPKGTYAPPAGYTKMEKLRLQDIS